MPRLRALTAREVISALEKNGFVRDRQTGSHIVFFHPGRRLRVVVPFHRGDLPRGTVNAILKAAGLDPTDTD